MRSRASLYSLALRVNARRRHLLVSSVLGKHIPVAPSVIHGAANELADLVDASGVDTSRIVVIGFAETATGLAEQIADRLDAAHVLVTTRYAARGQVVRHLIDESHSHAPQHLLLADLASRDATAVVVVDDELTTGRTASKLIDVIRPQVGVRPIVVCALVDSMAADDRLALLESLGEGGRIVSLEVVDSARLATDAAALAVSGLPVAPAFVSEGDQPSRAEIRVVHASLPGGLSTTSRHGWSRAERGALRAHAKRLAAELESMSIAPIHVIGTEEAMWYPQLVALGLESLQGDVVSGSTTRSPVIVWDADDYPIRTGHRIDVAGWEAPRFVYNLVDGTRQPARTMIVIVDDALTDDSDRFVPAVRELLTTMCDRLIIVELHRSPLGLPTTQLPPALRGPTFSTYQPDDVAWLLSDVTDMHLERPMSAREPDIQGGLTHYSESLPFEYRPTPRYEATYMRALEAHAGATASAVVRLCGALDDGGAPVVLVSLARAGVPVGVLMRQWLSMTGVNVPHYAISIIRDRGIDAVALDALVCAHGDAAIRFIDGWTGKGVIAGELTRSIAAYNVARGTRVSSGLAVLSDPLGVASLAATNEDILIPSACLNATVTGLISRSVRTDATVALGGYDGAAFYSGLATEDRTQEFITAVSAWFTQDRPELPPWERSAAGTAQAQILTLMQRYDARTPVMLKPGVGETTRVLLRRPARAIVLNPRDRSRLDHLIQLSTERDVPVFEDADMPFAAVGIVEDMQ